MILYHKSNLVYTVVFSQFIIFQQNNSAQTSVLIFFTSRHYYFFEKLKIVEKQLCKLNCSYCKVSHALKVFMDHVTKFLIIFFHNSCPHGKRYWFEIFGNYKYEAFAQFFFIDIQFTFDYGIKFIIEAITRNSIPPVGLVQHYENTYMYIIHIYFFLVVYMKKIKSETFSELNFYVQTCIIYR